MSTPEKKPQALPEATKGPEKPGIFSRISNWVRTQISKIPFFGWLKPKEPEKAPEPAPKSTETSQPTAHDTGQKGEPGKESKEAHVDTLELGVKGRCKTPGNYVGLSEKQRKNLGVQEKDLVELFDGHGKSLGIYIVGKIDKDVLKAAGEKDKEKVCTANVSKDVHNIVVKKTEKKIEEVRELSVKVLGKCKTAGAYAGLSEYTRLRLGVKLGDTITVVSDGDKKEFYTVGEITEESFEKANENADIITLNADLVGKTVLIHKKENKVETKLDVALDAEKNAPAKRASKIQERFGKDAEVKANTYITVPNPIAHELGCEYAKGDKKNIAKITKLKLKVDGKSAVPMIVVPNGQKMGFSKEAAKVLDIKDKTKKMKVHAEKGVLHLSDIAA